MLATTRSLVDYSFSKRRTLIAPPHSEEHRWTLEHF